MNQREDRDFLKQIQIFHSKLVGSNGNGNSLKILVSKLASQGVYFIAVDDKNKPLGESKTTKSENHIAVSKEGNYVKLKYEKSEELNGNFKGVEFLRGKELMYIDLKNIDNRGKRYINRLPNGVRNLIKINSKIENKDKKGVK